MRRFEQVASKARRDITQLHRPLKLKLKRCKDDEMKPRAVLARGFCVYSFPVMSLRMAEQMAFRKRQDAREICWKPVISK